jgi:hypothetical protein
MDEDSWLELDEEEKRAQISFCSRFKKCYEDEMFSIGMRLDTLFGSWSGENSAKKA